VLIFSTPGLLWPGVFGHGDAGRAGTGIGTILATDACTFMLKLCSSLSLIPCLLAAAYALKLGAREETDDTQPRNRSKELFVAGLATCSTVFLAFAAGVVTLATAPMTV
jgi:hypothetical protein